MQLGRWGWSHQRARSLEFKMRKVGASIQKYGRISDPTLRSHLFAFHAKKREKRATSRLKKSKAAMQVLPYSKRLRLPSSCFSSGIGDSKTDWLEQVMCPVVYDASDSPLVLLEAWRTRMN